MAPLDLQRSFECADVERFADAYVDGEFEASERSLLEHHLEGCPGCRVSLQRIASLRALLRARIGRGGPAPEGLRDRIQLRLAEVESTPKLGFSFGPGGLDWRRAFFPLLVGAATAGCFALFYVAVVPQRSDRWVVGDAAEMHARALPLEISTQRLEQLMPLFQHHLGFQVKPPALRGDHVLLEGGRLWHLGTHDAAYLQYGDARHGGRVSLFIVEDPGIALRLVGAQRTMLGSREVFLAHAQGRNVVVWRNQDVVYSLVSDLGEDETLALLGGDR